MNLQFTDSRFKDMTTTVKVQFGSYVKGGVAIQLFDTDGCPWATASVWVKPVANDCVAIKDYSENFGMSDLLIENGIIEEEPVDGAISGFELIYIYRLTPEAQKVANVVQV